MPNVLSQAEAVRVLRAALTVATTHKLPPAVGTLIGKALRATGGTAMEDAWRLDAEWAARREEIMVEALRFIVTRSSSVHHEKPDDRNKIHQTAKHALMDARVLGDRTAWDKRED